MNRYKSLTLLLSITFLFCFPFFSHLDASMHKFELKELVNESQMIVIGEIIETKLITNNPLDIYTKLTLKVKKNILSREKQISVGENLVFVTPDKVETPGMWTSTVVAKFSIGETVLVFLKRDPVQLKLLGGPQGKYTIEEGNLSEESLAIDYGWGVQELSELINRIHGIVDNEGGFANIMPEAISNDYFISPNNLGFVPGNSTFSNITPSWAAYNLNPIYSYSPVSNTLFNATSSWNNSVNTNPFSTYSSFPIQDSFNWTQTSQQTTSNIKNWYIKQQQDNQVQLPQTFLRSSPLDDPFLIWIDPTHAYSATNNSHIFVSPRADFWGNWYF